MTTDQVDEGRVELLRRANALVENAGRAVGREVDTAQVGSYIIERVRGTGTWIYHKRIEHDLIYSQTVSGEVLTQGDEAHIQDALLVFRAAMVLDDLANV